MSQEGEIQLVQNWAASLFPGKVGVRTNPAVRVEVRRQDHSVLRFGESCIDTPMRLAERRFQHGLGTHANSEILLHLPPDSREFRSWVGVDNNPDTGGSRGSVVFVVEGTRGEILRTPTLRGTNSPLELRVPIPSGSKTLTLKVEATPDGPAHDQADWADARVITADGHEHWADEDRRCFLDAGLPFSFRYGGEYSSNLLGQWNGKLLRSETPGSQVEKTVWVDPATSLQVTAAVETFKRYAAVAWVLEFENRGPQDTRLLADVEVARVQLRTGYQRRPVTLHQLIGDVCEERSFQPLQTPVELNKKIELKPVGGRSSSGTFPFFNLQYAEEGVIAAIGWSGQWQASVLRSASGPTTLRAGIEQFSAVLRPGEKIRTPRILLMPWKGDRVAAQNRFRRLMLFVNGPRLNGRPWALPVALQSYDRYVRSLPDWGTEAVQIRAANAAADLGCDTHWLDAAWFEGGFPNGVGNWFAPKDRFPNGLKPISDTCHARGLKFLVWFEPERVSAGSRIATEHPEFILGGTNGGLLNLGDRTARRWIADDLSRLVDEFGVDFYRNDFNLDPLPIWRQADHPDRQGVTEAAYVQGHYELWDELLRRHPGLMIDNCAGGGRRIDLETCARSVPLWHSDTGCSPGHADWNQSHIAGLSQYVPLFGACAWIPSAYEVRSAATAGLICQFAVLDPDFPFARARAAISEAKQNQKFWYGDFYLLASPVPGPAAFCAYQLHRSDLDSGIVLAFRRSECPFPVLQAGLKGLTPGRSYTVEFIDENFEKHERAVTGSSLGSDFELRIPERGASLLVRYRPSG